MLSFESPKFIAILMVLPLLSLVFWKSEKVRRMAMRSIFSDQWRQKIPEFFESAKKWQFIFLCLSFSCFAIALTKPFSGVTEITVEQSGVDVYFIVDVSPSMLAADLKPSRIKRTQYKINDFLKTMKGDRVGLIAFSGDAFVLMPLTSDYETFSTFVNELDPHLFPVPGTNIKEAIELAVTSFQKLEASSSKAIVLFSDGEDSLGLTDEGLKEIQNLDIKIYSIGVGELSGAPVPSEQGGYKTDENGKVVLSQLKEEELKKLSHISGGSYVRMTLSQDDVEKIYDKGIHSEFEGQKYASQKKTIPNYKFPIFVLLGLIFFLLDLLITNKKMIGIKKSFRNVAKVSVVFFVLFLFPQFVMAKNIFDFDKANKMYDQEKYSDANQKLQDIYKKNPQDSDVAYNLGNSYYKLGRYDEAYNAYLKALENPDPELQKNTLYNMGNTQFRKNQFEEAISFYEKSLKIDPDFRSAQDNLNLAKAKWEEQKQEQEMAKDKEKQQEKEEQTDEQNQNNQSQNSEESQKQDSTQNQDAEQKQDSSQAENQNNQQSDLKTQDSQKQENKNSDESSQNQDSSAKENDTHDEAPLPQQGESSDQKPLGDRGLKSNVNKNLNESWVEGLDDNPQNALKYMIQKKKSQKSNVYQKDW